MDPVSQLRDSKEQLRNDLRNGQTPDSTFHVPLLSNMLSAAFRYLKPLAPQLIPLTVFALSIPVVVFFSLSAGWFVWRSIAVGWETTVYLEYGDGPAPHAWLNLPNLAAQQPYDISVQLGVPATEANFALGNFMTTLTLATPSNKTIISARRPAIVTPPGFSVTSFLSRTTGKIDLDIPLLTAFETPFTNVLAHLEVGRADQWKSLGNGQGRELSVASAQLRGVVVHKGIRGLITRFPLLTAMVSSGAFLFVSFIILASCILPAIEWRLHSEADVSDSEGYMKPRRRPRKSINQSTDGSEWSSSKPRTPKRSRSVTTPRRVPRDDLKVEEHDVSLPSPTLTSPLRRRRSRLSQSESET
ncbi:putative adipose-regulatory protein-domain-containing protein [Cristinia sonorae]|uniref:Adipose-regulatory protein-domain-containing protein n=1 Tax=Cristinia sonorae TaxID=1940300 RepID=A0A8K0ULK9_9AGAR|nr:putative adipose-regulatory protein-domain-containing protein [Cristinia sonorae]